MSVQHLQEIAKLRLEIIQLRSRLDNPAHPDNLRKLAELSGDPYMKERLIDWAVLEKNRMTWKKEEVTG